MPLQRPLHPPCDLFATGAVHPVHLDVAPPGPLPHIAPRQPDELPGNLGGTPRTGGGTSGTGRDAVRHAGGERCEQQGRPQADP